VFSPGVAAEEREEMDILELLDMFFYDEWDGSFDSLNYKATDPDAVLSANPNMLAWVDIVGFRNLSRINNTDYIYGDPVACVIVESDVKDTLGWNDNVDWIDEQFSYNISNGNITVTNSITMLWHHSTETTTADGKKKIKKDYSYEFMTLTDTEKVPLQYIYTAANIPTFITFYNNTFSPKSIINVPGRSGLFHIEYSYNNETIKQNLMNGEIEKNSKGIEFINFSDAKKWDDPEGNLSHIAGSCIIKGANFTLENLNISLKTPYRSLDVTDYNLTIDNVSAGSCVNPSIIPFIAVIGLLLSTFFIIIKQAGR
jgi:hypothetical protein